MAERVPPADRDDGDTRLRPPQQLSIGAVRAAVVRHLEHVDLIAGVTRPERTLAAFRISGEQRAETTEDQLEANGSVVLGAWIGGARKDAQERAAAQIDASRVGSQHGDASFLEQGDDAGIGSRHRDHPVFHVVTNGDRLQHPGHAADVVGVVVGGDGEMDGVHLPASKPVGDPGGRWTGVDENDAPRWRTDERGVTLAYIYESDADLRRCLLARPQERSQQPQAERLSQGSSLGSNYLLRLRASEITLAEGRTCEKQVPRFARDDRYRPSQYVAFTRNTLSGRSASIARASRENS